MSADHQQRRNGSLWLSVSILKALYVLGVGLLLSPGLCSGQAASPRPVLFVHGVMGDSQGWGNPADPQNLRGAVITRLAAAPLGYTNLNNYDVYYDGIAVLYSRTGNPQDDLLAVESIPSDARFFTIRFYSGNSTDPFNIVGTAGLSILNKASELAHVLEAIAQITHVQHSVIVAHSQGGLVARAYLENLGSENPCLEILYQSPCTPGEVKYAQDVAHVVTLDSPYGGGDFTSFITNAVFFASLFLGNTPINAFELMPNSAVLRAINYQSGVAGILPQPLPPSVTIDSVESFLGDLGFPCPDAPGLTCFSDDVVDSRSQAIRQNIAITEQTPNLTDIGNPISANDPQIIEARGTGCPAPLPDSPFPPANITTPPGVQLHQISCVGHVTSTQNAIFQSVSAHATGVTTTVTVRATLNGAPLTEAFNYTLIDQGILGTTTRPGLPTPHVFTDVPLGSYTVANVSGGPSSAFTVTTTGFSNGIEIVTNRLGLDAASGQRVTDLVISINFRSVTNGVPTVVTASATAQQCDSAILNGSVNPNGSSANAYFEWGTDSQLSSFFSTAPLALPIGASPTPFNFNLTALSCGTTYFYRAVADNGGGPLRGSIVAFTTLATLPKPVLSAPPNGSFGVSTSPSFAWSTVVGATSYRLIVATTVGALPLDPTSSACGSGCVFNVTPAAEAYSPVAGALIPGTAYYWEVHARSPNQFGDWSTISSFTVGSQIASDFSLQTTPSSQTVLVSGSASYAISTATSVGSPQPVTLSATNLPPGVTTSFNPATLTSGGSSIMTVSAGATVIPGIYTLTVLATGATSSRSSQIVLKVVSSTGGGASFAPSSLTFPDQTAGTSSQAQPVTITNTGSGQLSITAISLAAGSDYFVSGASGFPINVAPNGQFQFQVVFLPSTAGPRPGQVLVWDNAPNSPQAIPLSGNGLPAPPTSATIQVNGTLNGTPLPNTPTFSYPFSYTLSGPSALSGGGAATFNAPAGTYTIAFSGAPSTLALASVTPSATQTIAAGSVTTFTLNFTAPNDFGAPFFAAPPGGITSQVVASGTAATYSVDLTNPPPGSALTPITMQVLGLPPSAIPAFNPQPTVSGTTTLTVSTGPPATPAGAYTLALVGTNSSGLSHQGADTASLVVTEPPLFPVQLVSQNSLGTQANAGSDSTTLSGSSADGRFVVFTSTATNLAPNSTNGVQQVYSRDVQSGTTNLVSADSTGIPADTGALSPSMSADGRVVAFVSSAGNLPVVTAAGITGIYLRDLQLGQTERADVTAAGLPANASSSEPSISADGRFVAFASNATNLVPETISGRQQVFIHDRVRGSVRLVSIALDGTEGNGSGSSPSISADGRFVAFFSNSSNLVNANAGGLTQVYVRDMESGQTVLASAASDGSPANGAIFTNGSAPAISADGRYVAFTSNANNLVPGSVDVNGDVRVFCRDLQTQTTVLVDSDASGIPLARGGINPAMSADGRFITYKIYGQVMIRDMRSNQSAALSLAADGTPSNASTTSQNPLSLSPGGGTITFDSSATNLITGDINAANDVFSASNPLLSPAHVIGITLDAAQGPGGSPRTGTVTLSSPAPASGVSVALTSNNAAATAPPLVLVPPGSTTGSFSLNTAIVSAETVLAIVASANGGSGLTVLTLEPAPALDVSPTSSDFGNQAVGTTSSPVPFTIRNTGTAALSINSIALSSGLVFRISSNTCAASVAAGSTCSISVTFNPTSPSPASDSLQINFGTPASTRSLSLFGNGAVPSVSFASGVLDFGNELVQTSALAVATVTNNGTAPLSGISASIVGTNSSEFAITSDSCSGALLPVNSNCLVTASFSPAAVGIRTASLTLSSNAPGNPPAVLLSGTGTDFAFGAAAGGPTSITVTAGQPATYNLQLNGISGFTGSVSLTCGGAPSLATCSVSPSQLSVTGAATPFSVTVTTTASHTAKVIPPPSGMPPYFALWGVLGLLAFVVLYATTPLLRGQVRLLRITGTLSLGLLLVSCGGGNTGAPPSPPVTQPGTPAGTYTLTVAGQANGATRSIPLTLVVH